MLVAVRGGRRGHWYRPRNGRSLRPFILLIDQVMPMRKAISGFRLILPIVLGLAFASELAAQPAEPSAAGLWQKLEKGKAVGWFLVIDHDGTFEGAFAKLFLEPGDPPNPTCAKCTDDRKDAPWLGLSGIFSVGIMLTLLIFAGEAVRDAFDPRKTFR